MRSLWKRIGDTSLQMWITYFVCYLFVGTVLQLSAPYLRIARFANDWQVISLYGMFLVPLSVLLRGRPWHTQYAYALVAIAPIDIAGFALKTSLAYPNNLLDYVVGERNFTLTFVVLASWIPFCGNFVVESINGKLLARHKRKSAIVESV